jgi:DNA-directed RNA polymerase specialized sigma24 family protein
MAKLKHDTSLGGLGRHFPVTEWTRILDTTARKAVLDELCTKYWKPLYSYLRSKGYGNEQAKDLVQGFFTEKVIDQELVHSADRHRGKFRNFLLVALRNYTVNVQRRNRDVSAVTLDQAVVDPPSDQNSEREFNRVWAKTVLEQVLADFRQECQRKSRTVHWDLFHAWLVDPGLEKNRSSMDDLCSKYGLTATTQAYKIIFRTKQRFRALLRERLRHLVGRDEDIDGEIGEFVAAFSR